GSSTGCKCGRQGQTANTEICQSCNIRCIRGVYLLHLPHGRLNGGDVQDEESVVVHGEAVCVALDQVYTLILQEPVVVGVLNPAVSGGADSGKVLVPKTHDRLALLHSGGLDYSHGIRHHVIGVSTVGGHHSGG